jgi:TRAP transporter TAXI family solute receptor
MNKRKLILSLISLCVILAISLIPQLACSEDASPASQQSVRLTFNTTPSGTPIHQIAVAWSTLIGKYAPTFETTVDPANGLAPAVTTFMSGRGDITGTASNVLVQLLPGLIGGKTLESGPWALITSGGAALHVITSADSKINSVADFRGKKILGKVVGAKEVDMMRIDLLASYGMTDNDIILLSGNSNAHNITQLREGVGDVVLAPQAIGYSGVVELSTMKDVRFISIPKEKSETFAEKNGAVLGIIPANTYPKQDKDIETLKWPLSFACRAQMDEKVSYTLVKVLYEHWDEFLGMFPAGKEYAREQVLTNWFQPFHPGAIKYYKEKGMWTADMDGKQQQLIKKVVPAPAAKP